MTRLFRAFLLLLARATDRELARQVQFLKVENEILRSKLPRRIHVTTPERNRLLKFGKKLGSALYQLLTIVSPRTFYRWLAAGRKKRPPADTGRPKTAANLRDLVVRLARENSWGYSRILGELKKLGVRGLSRSTVVNILKEHGLDPGPKRGRATWSEFVARHAKTLWACDFFQKKIWTTRGLVDYFLLFFMHVGSRRVFLTATTVQPDNKWVVQQARNIAIVFQDQPIKPEYLIHDLDSKFPQAFDEIVKAEGVEVIRVGPLSLWPEYVKVRAPPSALSGTSCGRRNRKRALLVSATALDVPESLPDTSRAHREAAGNRRGRVVKERSARHGTSLHADEGFAVS